jgi:hypothetical protein
MQSASSLASSSQEPQIKPADLVQSQTQSQRGNLREIKPADLVQSQTQSQRGNLREIKPADLVLVRGVVQVMMASDAPSDGLSDGLSVGL